MPGCWTADLDPPPSEAFHVEWVVDPFTLEKAIGMVRHPGHPFCALPPADSAPDNDAPWRAIGVAYLSALSGALPRTLGGTPLMHQGVWQALQKPKGPDDCRFGWLENTWQGPVTGHRLTADKNPLGSFWVEREDSNGSSTVPRLLVLLAGNVVSKRRLQVGSDVGLRLVLHVYRNRVRIHGVTLAGLSGDRALHAIPPLRVHDKHIDDLVRGVKPEIAGALKCKKSSIWIANLETTRESGGSPTRLSASGYALRWRQRAAAADPSQALDAATLPAERPVRARAYDFRVDVDVDPLSGAAHVAQIHRDEYVGSGADRAHWNGVRSFVADPASQGPAATLRQRRPTLPDEKLNPYRAEVDIDLLADGGLQFSDPTELFETRSASAGDVNLLGGRTVPLNSRKVVALREAGRSRNTEPAIRSDLQASIETHVRAADLFARLQGYGIDPNAYFRFARLPLVQRARPAMRWAPDGELPNAEVRPFLGDPDADPEPPKASDRLQLLVKYGSADPMHRDKLPMLGAAGVRRKAQYLSVACDPRWAWHEFGHVLNFASTGELELPFAHSAGDALAAIAADPLSELAGDDLEAPIRFVTFPWIEVPGRSHGRTAERGYGWCGRRNLVRLDFRATLERYHHSYFGEQLMSSSLFRLYRSLGGDTRGDSKTRKEDEAMRLEASDYCIYLIMRGLSLLGPDTVAPARSPDQLVSALIDADLGTGSWRVAAIWPFNRNQRLIQRQGGRVHKVIRWAFERQGLYATDDPRATAEGPGLPPAVDVYIADRRAPEEKPGDGGYAPVPLRITGDRRWHAHGDWLRRRGDRRIEVKVANRGTQPARDVTLRAWWGASTRIDGPVVWHPLQTDDDLQTIAGNQPATFRIPLGREVPSKGCWFLVSADAPADPANLASGMPPPSPARELMELVAHDNNLALAWL
jgi:hypothetical protein